VQKGARLPMRRALGRLLPKEVIGCVRGPRATRACSYRSLSTTAGDRASWWPNIGSTGIRSFLLHEDPFEDHGWMSPASTEYGPPTGLWLADNEAMRVFDALFPERIELPAAQEGNCNDAPPADGTGSETLRAMPKRTYQPNVLHRKRTHGFLRRMRTKSGRNILERRRRKGRWRVAVT